MSLSTGRNKLYKSMKSLRARWDKIKDVWDDPVQREFEEKIWIVLEDQMASTLQVTDRLDQVLGQMQRECS